MYITNPEKLKNQERFNKWLEKLVHDLRNWVADKGQMIGETGQISVTLNDDGTITFSLVEATGWPYSPGATVSFDDGTRTFTVTDGGSAYYFINGTKYLLNGNHTVTIGDIEGVWFIYFDGDTLTASQTPWVLTDNDKALVGYVHWDATDSKSIFIGYEFHTYVMDAATHSRLHHAGGTAWDSGLAVSDTGSDTLNVAQGDIHDEDIEIEITDGSGGSLFEQVLSPAELPIYYLLSGYWRKIEVADKNNLTDVGYVSGTDLQYNDLSGGGALASVSSAKYMAMWVYATNDIAEPVIAIMGQREDSTYALAIENNSPSSLSFGGSFLAQEAVLLARVIIQESGSGIYYTIEDITDYRGIANTGGTGFVGANDHGALSGLNDVEDHPSYLLMDGSRDADYIQFNLAYSGSHSVGRLHWNSDDETLELGMVGGEVLQQIGSEMLLPKRVRNTSGVDIKNGQPVYITGGSGSNVYVALAGASTIATSLAVGVATEDIDDNSFGWVTTFGLVRGSTAQPINTSSYAVGAFLYLSETTGELTSSKPEAPAIANLIAQVFRSHPTEGILIVHPVFVPRLLDLSDVYGEGSITDNAIPQWDSPNSRFNLTASPSFSSLTVSDGGYIGSVSTPEAIQIVAGGDIHLSGDLTIPEDGYIGTSSLTTLLKLDGSDQSLVLGGIRPLSFYGSSSLIKKQVQAGGWAFGTDAIKYSDSSVIGSWGFYGTDETLNYGYFGTAYNDTYLRITPNKTLFINESANTFMTTGLTVNQGAADNEMIALKSSDVNQPSTALTETDTFFTVDKLSGALGAARLTGYSDSDYYGICVKGVQGSNSVTYPPILMQGYKNNGSNGITTLGDSEKVLSIYNGGVEKWYMAGNGAVFQTGVLTVNASNAYLYLNSATGNDSGLLFFENNNAKFLNRWDSSQSRWELYDYGLAADIMFFPYGTGLVTFPYVYAHDMNGETIRDLQINSSGELGYDSSTLRHKIPITQNIDTSWIHDIEVWQYSPKKNPDFKRVGFFAEQLNSVVPSEYNGVIVNELYYDEDGATAYGPDSINGTNLIPFLVAEIQNLKNQIEEIKAWQN